MKVFAQLLIAASAIAFGSAFVPSARPRALVGSARPRTLSPAVLARPVVKTMKPQTLQMAQADGGALGGRKSVVYFHIVCDVRS